MVLMTADLIIEKIMYTKNFNFQIIISQKKKKKKKKKTDPTPQSKFYFFLNYK